MKNHPVTRRDFCKAPLLLACAFGDPLAGKPPDPGRSALHALEADPQGEGREETIYTAVCLEFVPIWDQLERIKYIKERGLGNLVVLDAVFHVGPEEEERQRWKKLYPELAQQIDRIPKTKIGTSGVLPIPERLLVEEAKLCRENGLYFATRLLKNDLESSASLYAKLRKLREVGGEYFVTYTMLWENTSILSEGRPASWWKAEQGIDPTKMNMQRMHDWFVARDRREVLEARKTGVLRIDNIEATAQFRLALEGGMDIPVLELVPYEPLGGLAAVRGAAKAHGSPFWGVCFALGWYRYVDLSLPNRAHIAYNLFYAGGARLFYDLNYYFHHVSLHKGWFGAPRPPLRMGEKEYRGFDDPICVAGRKVLQDHYKFVQFHDRPKGGPRVKLAIALGHLDSYIGWIAQSHVWGVAEPGWEAGDAEKTWQYFHRLYDAEPWYTPPLKDYWQNDSVQTIQYGTPPCGQVDIVPVEAPLEVLQSYSCVVFLGWNTMTEDLYEKLKRYVQGGGHLFMSLPQLSTQVERQADLQLIRGGDYGDLFGARIVGAGEQVGAIQFVQPSPSACPCYQFPEGTKYEEGIRLAKAEIGTAKVLAATPEGSPVLLENREGKGFAYLLTSWGYPGQRLQRFMTDLLRTIANGEQDEIRVEGESLFYAVYGPKGEGAETLTTIYLVNRSFYGLPAYGRVAMQGKPVLVEVKGYDMRIVWKAGDLVVSPFDRFVKVEKVEAQPDSYGVSIVAEQGVHRIQLACLGKEIERVLLDGKAQVLARDVENLTSFESSLGGKHELTVQVR